MKKSKQIIRNIVIILLISFFFYYFGGYYISKEECVKDTIRGLYVEETEYIMELKNGNFITTLVADMNEKTFSIIGTQKDGFLYYRGNCSTGMNIDEEHKIYVTGMYFNSNGMKNMVYLYRNDPAVSKVEMILEDGTELVVEDWTKDFAGVIYDSNQLSKWSDWKYRLYAEDGSIIEEFEY